MLMEVLYETAHVPTLQQIFGLLNAHGDAHEVVWKAPRGAHLSRNGGVAHVARQRYERGHAAKADSDLEELCLLGYRPACLRAAQAEREVGAMTGRWAGPSRLLTDDIQYTYIIIHLKP